MSFVQRHPWGTAIVVGIALITLMRPLTRRVPDPPAVTGSLSGFSLLDARGDRFDDARLAGRVWVCGFYYVDDPRPRQVTDALADLAIRFARVDRSIHVVGISVDPEHDTPERVARYASTFDAPLDRWDLLTGPPEAVRAVIVDGFEAPMGPRAIGPDGRVMVGRSDRLVIVDGEGQLRGSYPATRAGADEAYHRAQHVLRAARTGG